MRVEWRPMALSDRAAIMDHIGADNPASALELDDEFVAKADQAAQRPTLYKPGRVAGTREIVVRPSYVMVYSVDKAANALAVLRVLNAAQKWPPGR